MQKLTEISPSATPAAPQWEKIGIHHHHGIAFPLFSIHTEKSCGIGEYPDLLPLIRWCHTLGFDVIQLLPLNDTGTENSPYSSLSAYALNPLHLGISSLPYIEEIPSFTTKLEEMRKWNRTERVNYKEIHPLRRAFLKEWFKVAYPKISSQPEYLKFLKDNSYWLTSYALFKSIKEAEKSRIWEEWPEKYKNPSESGFAQLLTQFENERHFHELLQYFCFKQLKEIKSFAESKDLLIKGDIPILINRDSADVWSRRHLFSLDIVAGAPPDRYAQEGQYWGFPIYNWEEMENEGYAFWKQRLAVAAEIYDLYRLDHVVGFFRIWGIPLGKSAKEGKFYPSDEGSWANQGTKILTMMLNTSPLFPIAEDLGMVPPSVRMLLLSLGICGTKMMRWERRWDGDRSFIPPSEYPKISMTTVSTHDSDTLKLWWENAPEESKLYCQSVGWQWAPTLSLEKHREILFASHHSHSLFHINLLSEYLALFPELASRQPQDERINIPGKVLDTNWTYRTRPSIDEFTSHTALKFTLQELID